MPRYPVLIAAFFLAGLMDARLTAQASVSALEKIRPETIRNDMAVLADDRMEGRETGTPGFDRAAEYVARQFRQLHLRAVSPDYRQKLTVRRARVDETRASLTLAIDGVRRPLVYGRDFVTYGTTAVGEIRVDGDLWMVGNGVAIPGRGIDPYRGLKTMGQIVLAVPGAPPSLGESEGSYYGSAERKAEIAADHGAAVLLLVDDPDIPWELRVRTARQLGATSSLPLNRRPRATVIYLNRTTAEQILGESLGQAAPRSSALGRGTVTLRMERRERQSANVVALLEGSNPSLASECIVITAHLDHVGIGAAVDGDVIYNGAVDNASGVAALLTLAQALSDPATRPGRSIIFVATTGEEQGEVGSDYFVRYAPVPISRLVANINIDGVSVTPFTEAAIGGGASSSLGHFSEEAARQLGIQAKSEPIAIGGSDHSPFIAAGIPALWIGAALSDEWMRTRYHTPQDDMKQPLDFDAAARYTRLLFLTTYLAANSPERPHWNVGEFFASLR